MRAARLQATVPRLRPVPWPAAHPAAALPTWPWTPNASANALSLPEQIADAVGRAIIGGQLQAGERVHEQQIVERFAVSRGPAREALRILERDGLVQIHPRRGARVTALTVEEVEEVFEMRAALLGIAARRLARLRDSGAIDMLRARVDALRTLVREDDSDAYVQAAQALNLALVDACGAALLRSTYFSLANRTLRYTRLGLSTATRRRASARKWRELAEAIGAGDDSRAQALAESLVDDSRAMAVATLRPDTRPPPAPRVIERT